MTTEASYYVYILASGHHGTLYIGVTNDLRRRLEQHRAGKGSRFVSKYKVNRLVYVEAYPTTMEAIAREKQLKNWHRDWKIELIEKDNLDWSDLSGLICGQ
jgi:putative endonuclease